MTGIPHPHTITMQREAWRAEMYAAADRDRRAREAEQGQTRSPRIFQIIAVLVVAGVVAFWLAASVMLARGLAAEMPAPESTTRAASQVVENNLLDPTALQEVTARRL